MVKMKIKSWLLVGLVLISLLTSPAAAEITIHDIVKKIDLFISPNSYDAYPGQSMIFELAFYNPGPYDRYYFADVFLVGGDLITTTENRPVFVRSNEYGSGTVSFNAPDNPGTYQYIIREYNKIAAAGQLYYAYDDVPFRVNVKLSATATLTPAPTQTQTENTPPLAKISYENKGNGKLILKAAESSDPDGTIESYGWYINGQFINGQSTFTHVFADPGTYEIKLTVEDDDGATAEAILTVSVTETNTGTVEISHTDNTQAGGSGPTQRAGVWVEDGALKIPGFDSLMAITGLLIVICLTLRNREDTK
jgi:PKD repeat protein